MNSIMQARRRKAARLYGSGKAEFCPIPTIADYER
jgi:hypothetical protein